MRGKCWTNEAGRTRRDERGADECAMNPCRFDRSPNCSYQYLSRDGFACRMSANRAHSRRRAAIRQLRCETQAGVTGIRLETTMTAADSFLEARDLLLRHRTDYERAYREFQWPVLDDFYWALDYFDVIARGNDSAALWIVDDTEGRGLTLSYAQMAERSNRVANFLRGLGVGRGDRLLLMLPNRVELWDTMLASMKLGAIVLPATTQLSPDDVRDRVQIGGANIVVVDSAETAKFDALDMPLKRISVGAPRDGWTDIAAAYESSPTFVPEGATRASD